MAFGIQLFLFYLAVYFIVSGLDEISIDLRTLYAHLRRWHRRSRETLPALRLMRLHRPKKIAIMVPLWKESRVVRAMVETNLRQIEYQNFTLILGLYRNDEETVKVATELAAEYKNVETVFCSRPGPTSKADCLNHIYRQIEETERRNGCRFEVVMLHDAEDLLHPISLLLVNWFADRYGMVQVPVLPFPTGITSLIHGVYCDEFAEYLSRDMRVREYEGAFLPSNGVGTAIRREWMEAIRDAQNGVLFDAECLTEDYELGMKLHLAGCRQMMLPMTAQYGEVLATREYFPRTFQTAVRQRSRWISGQCLQAWERHGWPMESKFCYWFWRDRKGLWGNLLSVLALLLLTLSGAAWLLPEELSLGSWLWLAGSIPGADFLYTTCSLLALERAAVRVALVSRLYGIRFAAFAPLRMAISTVMNALATILAFQHFARSRWFKRRQAWIKTEHAFPAPLPMTVEAVAGPLTFSAGAGSGVPEMMDEGFEKMHSRSIAASPFQSDAPVTHAISPVLPAASSRGTNRAPNANSGSEATPGCWENGLRPLHFGGGEVVVEIPRHLSPPERLNLTRHTHVRVRYVEQCEAASTDSIPGKERRA